jgi:Flp pilus assembly protein TadG
MVFYHLCRFLKDRRANILPLFGISLIPVVALVGAGVDYSRANSVKSKLQAALDSTALAMASNAATVSAAQLQTNAQNYFSAMFDSSQASTPTIKATYTMTSTGPQVAVTGNTTVKTLFMNLPGFGISQMPVGGASTAAWGNTRLRVALALDNTGSMADDGKMTALKTATKNLLTQLKASATNNGDVYVSIIPFAMDVNAGKTNYTSNWIDWSDWEDDNGHDSSTQTCTTTKTGRSGRSTKKCTTSTTWIPDNHNTWNGCITDRDQSFDTKNTTPNPSDISLPDTSASTLFPADQYDSCPVAMVGQNYNWTAMNTLVDSMQPAGNTNTAIGLAWAWQSLTAGAPLNAPSKDPLYTYTDVIILLTDGLNTQDRWYTSQASIDARNAITCTNIKAAGVQLYTIQVNTGGDPTSSMLKTCASDSNFFLLTNASQIVTLFTQLGTKLSRLRVAK